MYPLDTNTGTNAAPLAENVSLFVSAGYMRFVSPSNTLERIDNAQQAVRVFTSDSGVWN